MDAWLNLHILQACISNNAYTAKGRNPRKEILHIKTVINFWPTKSRQVETVNITILHFVFIIPMITEYYNIK